MSRLDILTDVWLLYGGKSPLPLWPSLPRTIPVTDQSETEHAEIAVGKNTKTGEWVASIHFSPELQGVEHE